MQMKWFPQKWFSFVQSRKMILILIKHKTCFYCCRSVVNGIKNSFEEVASIFGLLDFKNNYALLSMIFISTNFYHYNYSLLHPLLENNEKKYNSQHVKYLKWLWPWNRIIQAHNYFYAIYIVVDDFLSDLFCYLTTDLDAKVFAKLFITSLILWKWLISTSCWAAVN